jgi:hypothetical protein
MAGCSRAPIGPTRLPPTVFADPGGGTLQATPTLPRVKERGDCHPVRLHGFRVGGLAFRPIGLLRVDSIVPLFSLTLPSGRR